MRQRLFNKSKRDAEIANFLVVARNFYTRLMGLMGEKSMDSGAALWITRCNSIHTFFMRFPIDVLFVDQNMIVQAKYESLHPWRMTRMIWKASSVIEMPAGTLKIKPVDVGDQLYVGD
jgi:uncharacterized membrane protein (UPF0127 family)